MYPEVQSDKPGSCPKCGMALEPSRPSAQKQKIIYNCPMYPQIEQEGPGQCPICGMALEPKTVQPDAQEDDFELRSMTLRFWVAAALTVPVLLMSMFPMIGVPVAHAATDIFCRIYARSTSSSSSVRVTAALQFLF